MNYLTLWCDDDTVVKRMKQGNKKPPNPLFERIVAARR
jgi:hypothetical protein